MKKKYLKFTILIITLLFLDLLTKYFFYDLNLLSWIFNSQFNLGIARSIKVPILITISISIIALIWFFLAYIRGYIWYIVTWLLISGTLGNLIDRILLGWVRDFIDIKIFDFPIFNIADILLNIWIIIFILHEIWPWKKKIIK